MLELTPDNVRDYLRQRGFTGVRAAEPLSGGVSNVVFRVEAADRRFVLKQSRPQLRTAAPWFSDRSRIFREIDVMQALAPVLPGVVPEVLFRDDANHAFAMSHAPEPCRDWRSVLLSGGVAPSLGARAGAILQTIHAFSFRDERLAARFGDRTAFEQLRVDPFYARVCDKHPDLREPVERLIDLLRGDGWGLCHGDFSPKNLLCHAGGFTLVDYETAHFGDPSFDLGFFLSHLFLKSIHAPRNRLPLAETRHAFWLGYRQAPAPTGFPDSTEMALRHAGACLLARVDGTSPAPYLVEPRQQEAARRFGRFLLTHDVPGWWRDTEGALNDVLATLPGYQDEP